MPDRGAPRPRRRRGAHDRRHRGDRAAARRPLRHGPAGRPAREPARAARSGPGHVARHGQGGPWPARRGSAREPRPPRSGWARSRERRSRTSTGSPSASRRCPAAGWRCRSGRSCPSAWRTRQSAARRQASATRLARSSPHAHGAVAAWRRLPAARRLALVGVAVAAALLVTAPALTPPPWPDRLTVRFLDVGQGDATLVQHPDGTAVLFDGGPPEAHVATLLRRLGVRRLALVVATHQSRDHHGGLAEVIQRLPGRRCCWTEATAPATRATWTCSRRRAAGGCARVTATAPLSLRAGGLTIRVLSPSPRPPGPAAGGPQPARGGGRRRLGRVRPLPLGGRRERCARPARPSRRRRHEGAPPRQRRPRPAGRAAPAAPRAGGDRGRRRQHLRPSGPVDPERAPRRRRSHLAHRPGRHG